MENHHSKGSQGTPCTAHVSRELVAGFWKRLELPKYGSCWSAFPLTRILDNEALVSITRKSVFKFTIVYQNRDRLWWPYGPFIGPFLMRFKLGRPRIRRSWPRCMETQAGQGKCWDYKFPVSGGYNWWPEKQRLILLEQGSLAKKVMIVIICYYMWL